MLLGSKLAMGIGAALAAVAMFFTWLHFHDKEIRNQAILEFNNAQMQIVEKSDLEYKQKVVVINKNEEEIRKVTQQKDAEINELELQISLNAAREKGGTNPSSDHLKSIVKQLDKAYGVK